MNRGTVAVRRIEGTALKDNFLSDPAERDLYVYLPPSYDSSSTRFATVYCLAGFTGSARSWFNFQAWIPSIEQRMDNLIASGMPEMILVFPDCFTKYGGSQYLDSPAVGCYRTYLLDDIIPAVDREFRTRPSRLYRAIMGKSSGGYGAITIAMEHPDVFSAVACHSGDMYFEYCYLPEFAAAHRMLESYGGIDSYLLQFEQIPKYRKDQHTLSNIVAMSACYSPNPGNAPHHFDLPFQQDTGEINIEAWAQWKACDPVEQVITRGTALREFGLIFLDCGKRDEFGLYVGNRIFQQRLTRLNIPCEYEEFDDGHFNTQYRYDVSLRKIANYFTS